MENIPGMKSPKRNIFSEKNESECAGGNTVLRGEKDYEGRLYSSAMS